MIFFCRPPILIFFFREIFQRVSSASALGRFFLRAHSQEKSYLKFCMASANSFFLDGAFSAHLLGANEVQPTTSFAPKRGAQNTMTLLKR